MDIKKYLEKLESKQEKASFLRDFILNKKNKEKEREEAINLLNDILQSESLEEKVEEKVQVKKGNKQVEQILQQPLSIQNPPEQKQEYKPKDTIQITTSPQPLYSPDSQTTVRHLRSFLDRKGLLANQGINNQEINKQITNYFQGNISPSRIRRYSSILSRDEIEYKAFGNNRDIKDTISLGGKKETLYKIKPKEDVR